MTSDMVERVARAIDPVAWNAHDVQVREHGYCKEAEILMRHGNSLSAARAAIKTLMEPTEAMQRKATEPWVITDYQAMLTAALDESGD